MELSIFQLNVGFSQEICAASTTTTTTILICAQKLYSIDLNTRKQKITKEKSTAT